MPSTEFKNLATDIISSLPLTSFAFSIPSSLTLGKRYFRLYYCRDTDVQNEIFNSSLTCDTVVVIRSIVTTATGR